MTLKKTLCLVFTLLLAVMLAVSCDMGGTGGTEEPPPAPQVTLTRIEVVEGTVDTECYTGMELDTSRIELRAIYSNGTRKT